METGVKYEHSYSQQRSTITLEKGVKYGKRNYSREKCFENSLCKYDGNKLTTRGLGFFFFFL